LAAGMVMATAAAMEVAKAEVATVPPAPPPLHQLLA